MKIIIVGCYRAGSSYLAKKLIETGFDMGDWINKEYAEDSFVHAINYEEALENTPHLLSVPHKYEPSGGFMGLLEFYKKAHGDKDYGFKDPMIVRYMKAYSEVWPDAKYVFCCRNPLNSIWSQRTRKHHSTADEDSLMHWTIYTGNFLFYAKKHNLKNFIFNYDGNIEAEEKALSEFLEIDLSAVGFAKDFKRAEQTRSEAKYQPTMAISEELMEEG